ncbi:hypothetical protein J6590_026403 [Homalodisca vitripennis]|nr:hypothetical protein J6590_026403 [Homalodisca vitripennis]
MAPDRIGSVVCVQSSVIGTSRPLAASITAVITRCHPPFPSHPPPPRYVTYGKTDRSLFLEGRSWLSLLQQFVRDYICRSSLVNTATAKRRILHRNPLEFFDLYLPIVPHYTVAMTSTLSILHCVSFSTRRATASILNRLLTRNVYIYRYLPTVPHYTVAMTSTLSILHCVSSSTRRATASILNRLLTCNVYIYRYLPTVPHYTVAMTSTLSIPHCVSSSTRRATASILNRLLTCNVYIQIPSYSASLYCSNDVHFAIYTVLAPPPDGPQHRYSIDY